MRRLAPLAALLLLGGCVAETVVRHKPRKGPVKVVGFVDYGGGEVRYLTEGWGWFVSGRRRHAFRLMRKNCGKELAPQITDEYGRQDADVTYSGEDVSENLNHGMEHFEIQGFQHLVYECKPRNQPAAAKPVPAPQVSTATVAAPQVSTAAPSAAPQVSTSAVPAPPQEQHP